MCLIKNDPGTSGFKIVKIPTVEFSTVPNSGKSKKATCVLAWENNFPVKVYFLIWVKTLEKYNSQYSNVNDLVQQ